MKTLFFVLTLLFSINSYSGTAALIVGLPGMEHLNKDLGLITGSKIQALHNGSSSKFTLYLFAGNNSCKIEGFKSGSEALIVKNDIASDNVQSVLCYARPDSSTSYDTTGYLLTFKKHQFKPVLRRQ
jgi:hypothetical protein